MTSPSCGVVRSSSRAIQTGRSEVAGEARGRVIALGGDEHVGLFLNRSQQQGSSPTGVWWRMGPGERQQPGGEVFRTSMVAAGSFGSPAGSL